MEESNRCNARKDNGGRVIQQVANHSITGGGPESSATHSLCQEHCKTVQEPQGKHQRPSVRKGKKTLDSPTTDPGED
jgi:hypothetical protein